MIIYFLYTLYTSSYGFFSGVNLLTELQIEWHLLFALILQWYDMVYFITFVLQDFHDTRISQIYPKIYCGFNFTRFSDF